jgi:hypothetical protein
MIEPYLIVESFDGKYYIQRAHVKKTIFGKLKVQYHIIDKMAKNLPNNFGYGVLECKSLKEAKKFITNNFKVTRHAASDINE